MIELKDVSFQYEQGNSGGKIENINLTIVMECIKCKGKMINAKLSGDMYGIGLSLTNKKKGIFETAHESSVTYFVCIECGYIELKADKPKNLII